MLDLSDPRWDVDREARCLDSAERARAARGVPAVCRRRVLLRAALRRALGAELGMDARQVPLAQDAGRPVLTDGAPRRLTFSCSASGAVGIVAVTDGLPVGADVEQRGQESIRSAQDEGWLADHEAIALAALPAADRALAITRCWTQKEAVLKGEGVGLRRSPAAVQTPVAPRGRVGGWWLLPLPVPDGYVASVAVATGPPPVDALVLTLVGAGAR